MFDVDELIWAAPPDGAVLANRRAFLPRGISAEAGSVLAVTPLSGAPMTAKRRN
jgi:hypothetical protein